MVLKLTKNYINESKHNFIPINGLIIVFTIVLFSLIQTYESVHTFNAQLFSSFLILVSFGLVVASIVLTFMGAIYLLYTSLYDELGYKTFTLPISSFQIIIAKLLALVFWTLIISITTFIGFSFIITTLSGYKDLIEMFKTLIQFIFTNIEFKVILLAALNGLATFILGLMIFMFVGSVANSSYVSNNRNLKMFIGYLMVNSFVQLILEKITQNQSFYVDVGLMPNITGTIINLNPLQYSWDSLIHLSTNVEGFNFYILFLFIQIGLIILFGYLTGYMWEKKLEVL